MSSTQACLFLPFIRFLFVFSQPQPSSISLWCLLKALMLTSGPYSTNESSLPKFPLGAYLKKFILQRFVLTSIHIFTVHFLILCFIQRLSEHLIISLNSSLICIDAQSFTNQDQTVFSIMVQNHPFGWHLVKLMSDCFLGTYFKVGEDWQRTRSVKSEFSKTQICSNYVCWSLELTCIHPF